MTMAHQTGDERVKGEEVEMSTQISVSPWKFLPVSKPLSAIATSTIDPTAAVLVALAVITNSVEKTAILDLLCKEYNYLSTSLNLSSLTHHVNSALNTACRPDRYGCWHE